MFRRRCLVLVLTTLLPAACNRTTPGDPAATPALAAEPQPDPHAEYTITPCEPDKADVWRMKFSFRGTSTMSWPAFGTTRTKTTEVGFKYDFVEDTAEPPAGITKRFRRKYATAERIDHGRTVADVFQNKTVYCDKRNGRYEFLLDGGTRLRGAGTEHLEADFNGPERPVEDKLPGKPVKVNESWPLKNSAAAEWIDGAGAGGGFPIDRPAVTGTGRLTKVFRKGGRLHGVIEYKIVAPIKAGPLSIGGAVKPGGKYEAVYTVTACIDGSSGESEGSFRITGQLTAIAPPEPGAPPEASWKFDTRGETSVTSVGGERR